MPAKTKICWITDFSFVLRQSINYKNGLPVMSNISSYTVLRRSLMAVAIFFMVLFVSIDLFLGLGYLVNVRVDMLYFAIALALCVGVVCWKYATDFLLNYAKWISYLAVLLSILSVLYWGGRVEITQRSEAYMVAPQASMERQELPQTAAPPPLGKSFSQNAIEAIKRNDREMRGLIRMPHATIASPNSSALDVQSKQQRIPEFPWPPPRASTKVKIPRNLLVNVNSPAMPSISGVDDIIISALREIGHTDLGYYSVPSGYAIATKLEKIDINGRQMSGPERWATTADLTKDFSLPALLRVLFTANKGNYRIIVFVISPSVVIERREEPTEKDAVEWVLNGADRLPKSLASTPFSQDYACTALVYEMTKKTTENGNARLVIPGTVTANSHLQISGFYAALTNARHR